MNYGLYLPNFGLVHDARDLAALAACAERSGWNGLFLWDHVDRPDHPPLLDPWIGLCAAALSTTRLRLGALVTPLARRRPAQLARCVTSLDRLSNGRVVFGAGLGSGRTEEWGALGEPVTTRERAERLDEGLAVLAQLWSGDEVVHRGTHYRVEGARFEPTPAQAPRPPVWIGGYWPNRAPFRRAARWDGVYPLFSPGSDRAGVAEFGACLEYTRSCRADPEAPFDAVFAGDPARRAADVPERAAAGCTWWLDDLTRPPLGRPGYGPTDREALVAHIERGPAG